MSNIILPLDPLLQRIVAASDTEMDPPQGDTQADEHPGMNDFTPSANDQDGTPSFAQTRYASVPLHASLLQYASGLVLSKKLGSSSSQELHQFATASEPEREMMTFGLGLEIRDGINALIATTAAAGIHPDLLKNIKRFSAAGFFSSEIAYYTAPAGAKRSKNLQNAVYDTLTLAKVAHLPANGDQALKDKILQAIGREFTNHRSTVKDEMAKRKPGEPKTDIASFATALMRNTPLKVTRAHYGRVAFLSREYRTWLGRASIPGIAKEAENLGYWEWVDVALETVRKQVATSPRGKVEALHTYFEGVIASDEAMFSKAIQKAKDPREREKWQADVELAVGR
ncbi:hypothetical protein FRC07_008573, partial [Ceratobasidium sp. 392]